MWTLAEGITYSGLSTWEACQEQFALKYIDGLSPKSISIPLEFGNITHFGLQYQWKFSSPQETIQNVTNQYRIWRSKTLLNNSEQDTLALLCGMADVTFPLYCEYWDADDKHIDWIGREAKFDVPYEVMTPEGPRQVRLRGMRDGLFRVNNILGLFETKTKSKISESEIRDGLKADMQTLFYCFVTWLEMGEAPQTVKYNIIRRADTYRRGKGTEPTPVYLKRIKEDIQGRPDFYFMRFKADLMQRDLENFKKKTLDPLLVRFIHWWDSVKKNPCGSERWKSPYHSLNLGSLHSKYGKVDMWEKIVNNNSRPYRTRLDVFPELEDSFLVM